MRYPMFNVGDEMHTFYAGVLSQPMFGKILETFDDDDETYYKVFWSYPPNITRNSHEAHTTHRHLVEMFDADESRWWTFIRQHAVTFDEDLFTL